MAVTNVPGSPVPLYAFGALLREIHPVLPLLADHAVGIAALSYNGQVTFGINADASSTPDIDVLARGIAEGLEELRALLPDATKIAGCEPLTERDGAADRRRQRGHAVDGFWSDRVMSEMIDWDIGHYEQMAVELEPVAEHVVSLAHVQRGERVVDLATGTGNAALLAAGAGALVTGLDTARRLIDVARGRAVTEGVEASFVVGDMQALPFDDGSFDVALSVFGLIFAADASRAFDEMIRVLRPAGRALFSVWVPAGPIDAMVATFGRALAAATGHRPHRFAWHDADAVGGLAARHRAHVQIHEGQLCITAASPEAYLEANEQQHPVSVAGRPVLERAGTYSQVRDEALRILRQGNEDPQAFRVSSPYRVIEVHRPG